MSLFLLERKWEKLEENMSLELAREGRKGEGRKLKIAAKHDFGTSGHACSFMDLRCASISVILLIILESCYLM